jgi:phage N-6-adenine-methyltransferase
VLFSSKTCEWFTPPEFFEGLNAEFGPFDLDPCATAENAKCPRFFTRQDDGLAQRWRGRVFANPPYGRPLAQWMKKAFDSVRDGDAELVVCLVPARTDVGWWHEYTSQGEIRLLRGRLRFGGCENSAPFPSALVIFRAAQIALRNRGEGALRNGRRAQPHEVL